MIIFWTGRRADNRYRYNEVRQCWEFDDGVGPWTASANMKGMTFEMGRAVLGKRYEPQKEVT